MASLKKFPESQKFPLGADFIQIWGGIRYEDAQQVDFSEKNEESKDNNNSVSRNGRAGQGR